MEVSVLQDRLLLVSETSSRAYKGIDILSAAAVPIQPETSEPRSTTWVVRLTLRKGVYATDTENIQLGTVKSPSQWNNPTNPRLGAILALSAITPLIQRSVSGGGGVNEFIQLLDTPASYAGAAGYGVRVNATEDGLEFYAITSGGITQLTGDVTAGPGAGSQAATIANNAVTNAKAADMATLTIKGRLSAGTGDPQDLSANQASQVLDTATDPFLRTSAAPTVPGAKNSVEVDAGDLQLVGDTASPGNLKLYGTDGAGARGWYDQFGLDDNVAVVYVSKIGDDNNDGLSIDKPKLTVYDGTTDDASTAALALQSGGSEYVVIHILDAGVYTFDFAPRPKILLYGPAATMVGTYQVGPDTHAWLRCFAAPDGYGSGDTVIDVAPGESGTGYVRCEIIETRGPSGTNNRVRAVENLEGDFILFLRCPLINVCERGKGIVADNAGIGHIHAEVTELYLRGDDAVGIAPAPSGNGKIYGFVDHIVDAAGVTGTKAIEADSGLVLLTSNEINCDTAYDVSGTADVRITAGIVAGTRTGTPTLLITEDTFNAKVTGPASVTADNNVALYNGTTGKFIKDSGTALSTVGGNLISAATPAGVRWIRVNNDGTVSLRTNEETAFEVAGTRFLKATGQSGITTTWTDITGLSAPLVSGTYYEVEIRILAEIDNTGGGINLALNGPAFTYYAAQFNGVQSAGALNRVRIIAYDDMDPSGDNTSTPAANQTYFYILRAGIIPSASGTITARVKRGGGAGSITVRGGIMRVYQ